MAAATDSGESDFDRLTNLSSIIVVANIPAGQFGVVLSGSTVLGHAAGTGGPINISTRLPGDGVYSLTLAAEDEAGNRAAAANPLVVTLDQAGPTTLTAAIAPSASPTDQQIAIVGATLAGAVVRIYRASDDLTPIARATADALGAFRLDGIAVMSGDSRFRVEAGDLAGNRLSTFVDWTSSAADSLGPTIDARLQRDTGWLADDRVTSQSAVVATIDDPSGIARLTASLNGASAVDVLPWLNGAGLALSSERLAAIAAGATSGGANSLAGGTYSLVLAARDSIGNETFSAPFTWTLDTSRPVAPAPLDLPSTADSGTSVTDDVTRMTSFSLTTAAGADSRVLLFENGRPIATLSGLGATTSLAFALSGLSDGEHQFIAVAEDAAGNRSSFTPPLRVTIDTASPIAPTLELTEAFRDESHAVDVTPYDLVELTGVTTPGALVRLAGTARQTVADASGVFRFSDVTLAPGANDFTVVASDVAGNEARFRRVIQLQDRFGPTIEARLAHDTGLSSTDGITNDATITGYVRDASGVATFEA
ncbi:MAG TPA: Ig-like domain-containing protein, partial [Pirellulaceae bacterium]|nr:Ig-like domain-containing protein [Pirellulaceae bacterium]